MSANTSPTFVANLFRPRVLLAAIFGGCLGLLVFGLYLQHMKGIEPCPMCILQRYAFLAAGLIALVGALHGPRRTGLRIYSTLVALTALAGGGVAARQTWLIHNPPAIADCGPGLEYMVDEFPLGEALPMIFRGSGDCASVTWTWLGLSIPEWALVAFTGIVIATGIALVTAAREPARGDLGS
jgi:disulfide bond formation protein DsbB